MRPSGGASVKSKAPNASRSRKRPMKRKERAGGGSLIRAKTPEESIFLVPGPGKRGGTERARDDTRVWLGRKCKGPAPKVAG